MKRLVGTERQSELELSPLPHPHPAKHTRLSGFCEGLSPLVHTHLAAFCEETGEWGSSGNEQPAATTNYLKHYLRILILIPSSRCPVYPGTRIQPSRREAEPNLSEAYSPFGFL